METDIKYLYSDILSEEMKEGLSGWVNLYIEAINSEDPKSYIDLVWKLTCDLITELNNYSNLPEKINECTRTKIADYVERGISDKGFEQKKKRNFKDAITLFERVLELKESDLLTIMAIADCYYELHQYSRGIEYLNQVIQISPDYHAAYNNLSICYSELKDYERARKYAERAVELKPSYPDYLYTLGCVFRKLGNYEEALKVFMKADQADPDKKDIMYELANCYTETEATDKAVKILERMTLLFPKEPYSFLDLGIIYLNNKLYKNGLDYFKSALELEPDDPDIYYNIAVAYSETNQDNLAVDIYMKALLRNPELVVDFWEYGNLLLDLDISTEFKYEILSFGAEYGDVKAKEVLEGNLWLGEEE